MFGALALVPIDQIEIGLNIIKSLTSNNSKCKSLYYHVLKILGWKDNFLQVFGIILLILVEKPTIV